MNFKIGQILILDVSNCLTMKDNKVWEITKFSEIKDDQQVFVELKSLSNRSSEQLRVPIEFLTDMTGYKRGLSVV